MKRRTSGVDTEVLAVSANVQGRKVVVYDDMIRTGGSLIGAGKAYKGSGATEIWIVTTHGVLCGDAVSRLKGSGLFRGIVSTDTHPVALAKQGDFVRVESIAPLLVDYLRDEYAIG
jgi:ribose-phosphate pyrophosphokinase